MFIWSIIFGAEPLLPQHVLLPFRKGCVSKTHTIVERKDVCHFCFALGSVAALVVEVRCAQFLRTRGDDNFFFFGKSQKVIKCCGGTLAPSDFHYLQIYLSAFKPCLFRPLP